VAGESLNGLVESLRRKLCSVYSLFKPRLIILYGSYARGDYTEDSDIDVLVVADELPRDPRDAYEKLVKLVISDDPRITPIGMNTEVFLRKLEQGVPFILEVIEDGKVLCYDSEFLDKVMKTYREKRVNYERRGNVWIKVR